MPKPLLLLDLDRTVFDTDKFYPILIDALAGLSSTTADSVEAVYKSHNKGDVPGSLLHHNDFLAVLSELGVELDELRARALSDTETVDLLYSDARPLLDWAESQTQFEPMLLSFGVSEIQNIKVACCKPLGSLALHTTLARKFDYIAQNFKGRNGILVDDKYDQQLPFGWTEIHIDRTSGDYSEPVRLASAEWRITDLNDVKGLL